MQSSRLPACSARCRFSKPLCLMIVKLWRLNVIHLGITKSESGMQWYSRWIAVWRRLARLHFNWSISETGAWQLSNCETESPPEFLTMSELQPHIRLCSVLKARKWQISAAFLLSHTWLLLGRWQNILLFREQKSCKPWGLSDLTAQPDILGPLWVHN